MKKKILVALLAVVASGVFGGGMYVWWLNTPPSMPTDINDAAALLKSTRFQRLSDDRKLAYVARIRELYEELDADARRELRERAGDDEELRDAMRGLGEQFLIDRARQFAMASPMERQLMLDTIIGMMEQRRGERGGEQRELTEEEQQKREERREKFVERMDDRTATGNPQHQSYIGEFFKALRKRRGELGLPGMPGPRGR